MSKPIHRISIVPILILVFCWNSGTQFAQHALVRDFLAWQELATRHNLVDGRILIKFADQLELSVEQQDEIEQLIVGFEEQSIRMGADIKISELRLLTQLKSDPVDRRLINRMVREIFRLRTDFSIDYINYLFAVRETLSRKQLHQLKQIREENFKRPPPR